MIRLVKPVSIPDDDVTDIGQDDGTDIDDVPGEFEDTLEATADQLSPAPPEEPEVEEDPLEEVNVYLAYERFDQAEELVRKVIADNPEEHKYKLRLLEVFYSSNDKASYEATAKELVDAVGERKRIDPALRKHRFTAMQLPYQ